MFLLKVSILQSQSGSDGTTKTIELSLDEEDKNNTKAIDYKVIDGQGETGEAVNAEGSTWSTDKPTVAIVDSDGKVTAKSAGEATVTGTCGSPAHRYGQDHCKRIRKPCF